MEAELRQQDEQDAGELEVFARGLAAYPDDLALLYSRGLLGGEFHVPFWVVITCQAAIALGHAGHAPAALRIVVDAVALVDRAHGAAATAGSAPSRKSSTRSAKMMPQSSIRSAGYSRG